MILFISWNILQVVSIHSFKKFVKLYDELVITSCFFVICFSIIDLIHFLEYFAGCQHGRLGLCLIKRKRKKIFRNNQEFLAYQSTVDIKKKLVSGYISSLKNNLCLKRKSHSFCFFKFDYEMIRLILLSPQTYTTKHEKPLL